MFLRWLLATLHLFAFGIGLGAVIVRARLLRSVSSTADLKSVFLSDNLWGLAAFLWIGTGVLRAFAGFEKGTAYYLSHPLFHAKLSLFLMVFALELWPMIHLIRWRRVVARGQVPDLGPASRMSRLSYLEGLLVCVIVLLATAIARGVGV